MKRESLVLPVLVDTGVILAEGEAEEEDRKEV
jgi:hypothetical protein